MTLKDLRDYIDSLDLNEVQSYVELVVHIKDNQNGALDFGFVDVMADFQLVIPDKVGCKPYLSITGESFNDYFDSLDQDDRIDFLGGKR